MVAGLLENNCEVHLLAINTLKHFKSSADIEKDKPRDLHFYYKTVNTNITPPGALKNLLSGEAYHVSRFQAKNIEKVLIDLLKQHLFDVIQIEGVSMAVYLPTIRKYSKAKVSLRAHNAEFQIWDRHVENEYNPIKKWYLKLQNKRLKNFELQASQKVDAVITITEEDKVTFENEGISKPIFTLPCGMDIQPVKETEKAADVSYIASFDWMPNQQGLEWFLKKVYPKLISVLPNIKIQVAGKEQPKEWKVQYPNIYFEGWVENAQTFMSSGKVAIVPLLAGSGMRIKILDNMALGLPMVSTSIGAEGVKLQNGRDILLADTPEAFSSAIIRLLKDDALRNQMGQNARHALEEYYQNKKLGASLMKFYRTLAV